MKIELIEFYPRKIPKNKSFVGTFHVYIEDFDIDIRGINVYKIAKGFMVRLPDLVGKDPVTKKPVRYPLFQFANKVKHQAFVREIAKLVNEYFKENKYA